MDPLAIDKRRFEHQMRYLLEVDKLKSIVRQTYLTCEDRRENSAEHSWHLAMMALVLSEYANEQVDICHVIKLLLIHDLVEIDAGDTPCYDKIAYQDKNKREMNAANRVYNLLPIDQAQQLKSLWKEFEACQTLDSQFANALDRLQPLLSNYYTHGKAWKKHKVKKHQVVARISFIKEVTPNIWSYALELIED